MNTEDYTVGLAELKEIPDQKLAPRGKVAELQGQMQRIVGDQATHGRPFRIGTAPADTNAANRLQGAKATLRAKFGGPEVYGYVFQLFNEQAGEGLTLNGEAIPTGTPMKSLAFTYDPSKVVKGKAGEHEAKQAEAAAKAKAKQAA